MSFALTMVSILSRLYVIYLDLMLRIDTLMGSLEVYYPSQLSVEDDDDGIAIVENDDLTTQTVIMYVVNMSLRTHAHTYTSAQIHTYIHTHTHESLYSAQCDEFSIPLVFYVILICMYVCMCVCVCVCCVCDLKELKN